MNLILKNIRKHFDPSLSSKNSYYNSSNYYRENLQSRYTNLQTLSNFIPRINYQKPFNTPITIQFKGCIDFGMTEEETKAIIGKPLTHFINPAVPKHSVFFYKWHMGSYKTNVELHFYNNSFFLGVCALNSRIKNSDKEKIQTVLCEKYDVTHQTETNTKVIIADQYANTIVVNDAVTYTLQYLSGDYALRDNLHQVLDQIISKSKNKEARFDEYLRKIL